MSKCLNLSDKNVSRMVKDFGELNVSQLVDTYFGDNVPTYDEFINNKIEETSDKMLVDAIIGKMLII